MASGQALRARKLSLMGLAAPALTLLGFDLWVRAARIASFRFVAPGSTWAERLSGAHALSYSLAVAHGLLLWGSLLWLSTARRAVPRRLAGTAFVLLFTLALGVQSAFVARWQVYVSRDATELSERPLWAVLGSLRPSADLFLRLGLAFGAALVLVWAARRVRRPTRRERRLASVVFALSLLAALLVPVSYRGKQATTPDLLWLNALSFALRGPEPERAGLASLQIRSPRPLPVLQPSPARPRNVLLILQESQRADVTCSSYDPACALATPLSNALLPSRFAFENLRANASVTTIAMSVLFTGLAPTASKSETRAAPTLFEYAHAAGYDTAYLTSQHLLFANMWLSVQDVPSGRVVLGTHLDPEADMFVGADDALLSERATRELGELREPFFAVVHYANIHAPRPADDDGPFQPARAGKEDGAAYLNAYKNAVHRSDRAVAQLIAELRATELGARTVLLYTADHGEAVGEHGQGCDHGCSLFEEDIRVPGWLDAPDGTLTPSEIESLGSARYAYTFHLDLAPTVLDLLGLWDHPALQAARQELLGHPLTRPERTTGAVPLSNVAHVWERGRPSYGLMKGRHKLIGRQRDAGYACFDLERDPKERSPLSGDCDGLAPLAAALFGVPPSEFDRVAEHPDWGRGVRRASDATETRR